MKGQKIKWSAEELDWIEANCRMSRRERHAAFLARFSRKDISQGAIDGLCKRKGWLTGRSGQFSPGAEPPNKGKKMPFHPNSAATRFKKGHRPANKHDVGYESIDRDGYVKVCVAATNPWTGAATHMAFKHRILWEALNGPVPDGQALKCLDGNKANTDPSNWKAIPLAMLPRLNGRFGRNYDTSPDDLKPTIMAITTLEHRARMVRQEEKDSTDA